jgi:uncharacterized protein
MNGLASAIYEGTVVHCRHRPRQHRFTYRMAQLYLDLDELQEVFARRWFWSVDRTNVAQWRRDDFMAPRELPLADVVRDLVKRDTGVSVTGPVRMLAHLRYFGYVFNPVTFYYCFAADGVTLLAIVAEITNTPWRERHAYALAVQGCDAIDGRMNWDFAKAFHVSPFMALERQYRWTLNVPEESLHVHMRVDAPTHREFDATLHLNRRPMTPANLARVLWRYPFMTAKVIGAIHLEALRLWLKRVPVLTHPARDGDRP